MFSLTKKVFGDIFRMYKYFLHFNFSKIVIFVISGIYALLAFLPFLVGYLILLYFAPEHYINILDYNIYLVILFGIIGVFAFISIFAIFSYNYVLMIRLVSKYIDKKKLKITKNYYFNFKLLWNYYKLFWLNFLIILIPFLLGAVLILGLVFAYGGIDNVEHFIKSNIFNSFSIITLGIALLSILVFVYLGYKTLFSIIILVLESKGKEFKSSFYYIKKSFKKTKGFKKFFVFLQVFVSVFIMSLFITVPLNYYNNLNQKVASYFYVIQNPNSYDDRISEEEAYFLKQEFEGVKLEELKEVYLRNFRIYLFLEILNFLFIIGLFEMALVSFYKHYLKK